MRKIMLLVSAACLILAGALPSLAQEAAHTGPPKVLVVFHEFVKPGKAGAAHEKIESRFVAAMRNAKWRTHYLAVTSMTGPSEAWFLTGFDSYAAWEADNRAVQKNAALSAELGRLFEEDGALLTATKQGVLEYREELSYHAPVDIPTMRYFDVLIAHARLGHGREFEELVKVFKATHDKINSPEHWATYEVASGASGGTYVFITPRKSLAEIDTFEAKYDKAFGEALGEEGRKKLSELEAASTEKVASRLFAFSPTMSYVPDSWVEKDPGFWKPKTAAKPAAGGAKAPKKAAKK